MFLSIGSLLQLCSSICNQILHFSELSLEVQEGQDYFRFVEGTCIIALCLSSLSDFIRCILVLNITSEAVPNCFWSVCFNLEKTKKKLTQFNPPSCVFSHLYTLVSYIILVKKLTTLIHQSSKFSERLTFVYPKTWNEKI